ncbi:RNA polymerase II-associated protein 1 isoform X2 [Polyodon spathula]|uniref:RNA polymerase II-associated protein 1 isoform X2 n=1 Tax=Polyodon spathula TaxID=7913 RepID=UPI001B7E124D|nr:RNA polymerase II-associated protein 1 isoform X2 [Polyodon spathula]
MEMHSTFTHSRFCYKLDQPHCTGGVMLGRPKPGDTEDDLLRYQDRFLASGGDPGVQVIRRPDKRRGEPGTRTPAGETELGATRDIVSMDELPEQPPSLTPAPPQKKSRFRSDRVRFEKDDPAERLDREDPHLTAVLSRIIERDTSAVPVSFPAFTGAPFPKVFHRSEVKDQASVPPGRRSIFAQNIATRTASAVSEPSQNDASAGITGQRLAPPLSEKMQSHQTDSNPSIGAPLRGAAPRLVSGQGLGGPGGLTAARQIHLENEALLRGMSKAEILQEQGRLLAQLDPRLVSFVKSKKSKDVSGPARSQEDRGTEGQMDTQTEPTLSDTEEGPIDMDSETEGRDKESEPPVTVEDLPVKPQEGWVHMNQLEPEKLEWIKDLPRPRKRGTRQAMQARFDFSGSLIPPDADLPPHLGLHHHGEEPQLAGYSLQELFHLSRSQVTQQRSLALTTLARILRKARSSHFASSLRGSVLSTLLDAGLLFLLRFSLDDSVGGVMSAAVHALWALLVAPDDEECLDSTFSWLQGSTTFPLLPSEKPEEEEEEEEEEGVKEAEEKREERRADYDIARTDLIKALLKMQVLARLRYILEVVRPGPRVVQDVLEVLIRIARHSGTSASQVLDSPRLMQTVLSEFLPCSWTPHPLGPPGGPLTLETTHGLPVATAMKLVRVLACSGRHACARLFNSLGLRERLSRYLALEPQDLLLEPHEAVRLSTEALRLWSIAAGYGQTCDLYRELYPILVRALQCVPSLVAPRGPVEPLHTLSVHRAEALITLLTNITLTAGSQEELQREQTRNPESDAPPPPPVEWSHVTGLRPFLLGSLKSCVEVLSDPLLREGAQRLSAAILLYLGSFYTQLPAQSSFQPVQSLQEMESLSSEVLEPLLSHQAVRSMMSELRSCSALCNPNSCSTGPESIPSLPSLSCCGGKPVLSLAGSQSPFPFMTGLCYLLHAMASTHRGLAGKFSPLLVSEPVIGYLRCCCEATPPLSLSCGWLLRHEYQLQYLLLKLAARLIPVHAAVSQHASLYHQVAMAMLPRLLPGSEHLAHDLLSTLTFNPDFIPEGRCGGPEAADLNQLLHLKESHSDPSHNPTSQLDPSPSSSLGALLREAYSHLPSLRGCYLTHLSQLEPLVRRSRESYLGCTPSVQTQLLPPLSGPALPSDWPFLPLVTLYECAGQAESRGCAVETLPPASVESAVCCLQWVLVLEHWREGGGKAVTPAVKLCRLACLFLCGSDLFLEPPVQRYGWAVLRSLCSPPQQATLDLGFPGSPPPGLASFQDLYSALLAQFEAVSFGDPLFGCFLLLPLQRRFSAELRLAVFGEHVGLLRSLGVTLAQLPVPLQLFTSPPEDSLSLLQLYFRALVTGALRRAWCPVLYAVAIAHLNTFLFSQEPAPQKVDTARRGLLRKTYFLTDEVLRTHLLLFKLPRVDSALGFEMYEQLPPIRDKRLNTVLGRDRAEGGRNGGAV